MTAAAVLTRLPLLGAGYVASHAGRAAMWIVARYMRNPLTHTAIAALVATSAMAASNALFMQSEQHPAPWFTDQIQMMTDPEPVIPATKPKGLAASKSPVLVTAPTAASDTTASVQQQQDLTSLTPIGNTEVFELQKKLAELKYFTGKIDGYYGPQTASAIRRFEEANGLQPLGELNRATVDRIMSSSAALEQPRPEALTPPPAAPVAQPLAAVEPPRPAALAPAPAQPQPTRTLAEIAAPAPLGTPVAPATTGSTGIQAMAPTRNTFLGRPLPTDANDAVDMASQTANEALDTIVGGVEALADMTRPGTPPATLQLASNGNAATTRLANVPTPGVPLAIDDEPAQPGQVIRELTGAATPDEVKPVSVNDPVVVAKVQRGLGSLGFLHGPADGVAGEATAKAIRNFEVYYNYEVTGRISPGLLDLLVANGAAL